MDFESGTKVEIELNCITQRCSNAAKFALEVKYPPLSVPGTLNWKNREDSFNTSSLLSNSERGEGINSLDMLCNMSIRVLKMPRSAWCNMSTLIAR